MSKERSNKKNRKEKKKHRILKAFLFLILLIALFIGGFLGYSTIKNGWGLKGVLQTITGQDEEKLKDLEEFKVLILGVSEDISAKLTDTIMVASYNPRTQKAVLLSIPRDTFVGKSRYSANSYDKINALYQSGGAKKTLEAVNKLTGMNIKNYVVISNNALVELVDEIGGVEFNVPMNMDYDSKKQNLHIHLKKGVQKLNGKQAEGLVRYRKSNKKNGKITTYSSEYGNDDFGRMRTQRDFIKAVAKQTLKLKNITKLGSLIDIFKKNVDTNIKNWDNIKDYIPYAVEFDTNNIQTETIPGESARIPAGTGLWFFQASETETKKLVKKLYEKQNKEDQESEEKTETKKEDSSNNTVKEDFSNIKIEILNGTGVSSKLTEVTTKLKKAGYKVYKTGTTSKTKKTTIINKNNVEDSITNSIKNKLKVGVISNSSSSNGTIDITVILGTDYK